MGRFAPAPDDPVAEGDPGLIRWSREDGCRIKVLEPVAGWPRDVSGPPLVLHGITEGGDELTALDAWVTKLSLTGGPLHLRAATLVLGQATTPDAQWDRLVMATAHLHEWLPETGIDIKDPEFGEYGVERWTVEWTPIPNRVVKLSEGTLEFSLRMETEASLSPEASIRTALDAVFVPSTAMTLESLNSSFARPLLALMIFAADRADTTTSERVVRNRERGVVLRAGPHIEPREWQPDERFLFRAPDLDDLEARVRAWFDLYERTEPAIAAFCESVSAGRTFSPGRLVQVVTALESHHRALFGGDKKLENRLKELRDSAGVPDTATGCTTSNLRLLAVSRNWYAHLGTLPKGVSRKDVDENLLVSTRRATALMQASLLREIGVSAPDAERLLREHYRSWPIPS